MLRSDTPVSRPEVHGHRGCRGLFPENTLPGFLHAIRLGVDVLELDVVLSADGQVVVSHEPWMSSAICLDPYGQPIPPATAHEHNLYQLPYATIRRYDCGQLRHPSFPAQQPLPAFKPLLRDVVAATNQLALELNKPPVRFSIEVKSSAEGDTVFHPEPAAYCRAVLAEVQGLKLVPRATLLSFDVRILQQCRRQLPQLPVCQLVEDDLPFEAHREALGFAPEFYGPRYDLVSPSLIDRTARQGTRLVPWTVNDVAMMQQLLAWGVAGITTDYPDRLLAVLAKQ